MSQSAVVACLFASVCWLPNLFEVLSISLVMDSAGSFVLDDLTVAPHLDWFISLSIVLMCISIYWLHIPARSLKFAIAIDP